MHPYLNVPPAPHILWGFIYQAEETHAFESLAKISVHVLQSGQINPFLCWCSLKKKSTWKEVPFTFCRNKAPCFTPAPSNHGESIGNEILYLKTISLWRRPIGSLPAWAKNEQLGPHRQALLHPWPAQLPSTWHLVMWEEHCCYPCSPWWDLMAKDPIMGHWKPHLTPPRYDCFTMLPSISAGKPLVLVSDCFSLHSPLPISVTLFSHLQNQHNAPKFLYHWLSFLKEKAEALSFHRAGLKALGPQVYKHHKRFKTAKCEEQSLCKVTATVPSFPLSWYTT